MKAFKFYLSFVIPYTGCWCDFHYRVISIIHPLGFPGTLLYFVVIVLIVILVSYLSH